MNPYLTKKAEKKHPFAVTGILLLLFLLAACLSVTSDYFREKDAMSIGIALGFDALVIWPIVRIVLGMNRRSVSVKIARELMQIREQSLTYEQTEKRISVKNSIRKIRMLIDKGYLQYIYLDAQQERMELTVPRPESEKEILIPVKCPSCGGSNMIRRGKIGKCQYCDQPVMEPEMNRSF